jgi:phosphoribosylglycinamide formyltransferase 2
VSYGNLEAVLKAPDTQLRLFGKPEVSGHRRMGVVLARGESVEAALQKARRASEAVVITL